MQNAVIIAILESYEVFRRQQLWLNRFMPRYPEWEVIFVDDGSDPRLELIDGLEFNVRLLRTQDTRPWTQPCARNFGAARAHATNWFLMTDIDHIITEDCILATNRYDGHKIHFARERGILNRNGDLETNEKTLLRYGLDPKRCGKIHYHYNSFSIRRWIFEEMGGYDRKFCGKYGGDDTDFSRRYSDLHKTGCVDRSWMDAATMYVFPEPKADRLELFHSIRRKEIAARRERERSKT